MGHWNGDTKNQHTNKQQQWCAAATCTHLQNPHQNHPFSQLRAARLKLSERKELNNGTLEWGHKKPTHQQAQQQRCAAGTCTHLQNPHQNHPFSQLRDARLKMSGRKDLWAEAAALDASGSVGCDGGGTAMSIQQWNHRKDVGRCLRKTTRQKSTVCAEQNTVGCANQPVRKQLHVQSKLHSHAYKQDKQMKHANNTK